MEQANWIGRWMAPLYPAGISDDVLRVFAYTHGGTMKFTVPASVTISGWIEVEADSLEAAKAICRKLDEEGIDTDKLNDHDFHSDVHTDECEPMGDDGEECYEEGNPNA